MASALVSMKIARPIVNASRHAARAWPAATSRIHPRMLHVRCQAQGPQHSQEQQAKDSGLEKRGDERGLVSRRREDLMAPELSFRRMSDYIDNMQREMESMFDLFGLPTLFRPSPLSLGAALDIPSTGGMGTAVLNIEEDEKEYRVHADIPGFSKDNVKVTISQDGVLSIEGHEAAATKDEKAGRTRRVRNFVRRLKLPHTVTHEGISARVENGVLYVTIPKTERADAPAKEIPVQ